MAYESTDAIKRLFQRFFRDELAGLSAEERAAFEAQFEDRLSELVSRSGSPNASFADLIGFSEGGVKPFDKLAHPFLRHDFDEAIVPSQLHATA